MRMISILALCLTFGEATWASGYEKSIVWGGRSAGLAGIATPYMQGSQALYFNPAGLVSDKVGQDVSLNLSPTWSQFKGPINDSGAQSTSDRKMLVPFGAMYGMTVNENLGFGVGVYVSGGSYASYENVPMTTPTALAPVKTDLQVVEIAGGVGYRVNDKLKLGAAWRVVMAEADFAFVQRGPGPSLLEVQVQDLEDTRYDGFKLGAQYKVTEDTMLGFSYRSQVKLEATGKFGGQANLPGPATQSLDSTDATAKTTFPMAATLGVQHNLNENWRLLGEYVWTQYSKVDKIVVEGTVSRGGGTFVASNPAIQQDWKDQHNIRLASEYLGWAAPIRFGYVWTSQVTNDKYARAAFTPPGDAHTLTLGSGYTLAESFQLDGGLEYTWLSGNGEGAAAGVSGAGNDIRAGKYETNAYALHLGVTYMF